jgi:YidC/Oxa1 family membrane protein insertase
MRTKFGAQAKWTIAMPVLAVANMSVFISQFSAINTLSTEGLPSMTTEGLAWFPNLTLPDAWWGLPLVCCALTLAMVESGAMGAEMGQAQAATKTLKNVMRGVALIFVPAGAYVPSAVALLWSSNSLFSLVQAAVLRAPRVRRALGLPDLAAMAAAANPAGGPPSPLTQKLQQLMGGGDAAGGGAATAGAAAGGGGGGGAAAVGGSGAAAAAAGAAAAGGGAAAGGARGSTPPPPGMRPSRLLAHKPAGWKRRKT